MEKKDTDENNIFDLIEGLKPVDPAALEEFEEAMSEEVIPKIVEVVEERRLKAAVSRHWQLKC